MGKIGTNFALISALTAIATATAATPCSRFHSISGGVEYSGTTIANLTISRDASYVYIYVNVQAGVPFSVRSVFEEYYKDSSRDVYASQASVNIAPGPSSYEVKGNRFIGHVPSADACYAVAIGVENVSGFLQAVIIQDASSSCAIYTSLGPQFSGDESQDDYAYISYGGSQEAYYNAKKGVPFTAFAVVQSGDADMTISLATENPRPQGQGAFRSFEYGSDKIEIVPTEDTCYAVSIFRKDYNYPAQAKIAFLENTPSADPSNPDSGDSSATPSADPSDPDSGDSSADKTSRGKRKNQTVLIASIVGGVLFAGLVIVGSVLFRRRRSGREISVRKPLNTESVVAGSVQPVQGEIEANA